MSKKSEGLASDYIQNASNFIWAAESLNQIAPQDTVDGMFRAESPIYFLLGHASELILKSVLAKNGIAIDELRGKEYGHDLTKLISKVRECQMPLDKDFLFGAETIAENYKNHEHRYARTFSGFSDEDHKKWERGELTKMKQKEYGLMVRSGISIDGFIKGLKAQTETTANYLNARKAA